VLRPVQCEAGFGQGHRTNTCHWKPKIVTAPPGTARPTRDDRPSPDPDAQLPGAIQLGHWRGIALRAHWSTAITVFLVADILAVSLPITAPHHSRADYWITGLGGGGVFVKEILAHELAHAAVARHYRMPVRSVTLWMLGGVTALGGDAPTPRAEVAIAAAGPATTFVIAAMAALGAWLIPSGLLTAALSWLAVMSLVLAVFNLLPAAPLDGGRVLRGIVWWRLRDRDRANTVAASAGRGLGVVLIAQTNFGPLAGYLGGLWLVLLGWFIRSGAIAEQAVGRTNRLADVPVERAMSPVGVIVPQWWTVQQVVAQLEPARPAQRVLVAVDIDGKVRAAVTPYDLARVPAARRDEVRIADLTRVAPPVVVELGTPLAKVAPRLQVGKFAVVVDETGRPVGIVTAADIEAVMTLTELGVRHSDDQSSSYDADRASHV